MASGSMRVIEGDAVIVNMHPVARRGAVPVSIAASASVAASSVRRGQEGKGGRGLSRAGRRRGVPCGTDRRSTAAM